MINYNNSIQVTGYEITFYDILKKALTIRKVEEKLLELHSHGKITGTVHSCIGQEFSAVAFCAQLEKDDFVLSNHRNHGHYISFTDDIEGIIAEILGLKKGVCAGIGGSMNLYNTGFISNGIVGGLVPVSAGVAYSNRILGNKKVTVIFIGDGTLGQGNVYETMNIASILRLPLLIVCENNFYSYSTTPQTNLAGDILKRAESFNLRTFKSDIWNTGELFANAKKSIDYVRDNCLPAFHIVDTYRLKSHSTHCKDTRGESEIRLFEQNDPLNILAENNRDVYSEIEQEISRKIDGVIIELENCGELKIDDYYTCEPLSDTINEWEPVKHIDERQVKLINEFFHSAMEKDEKIIFMGEDVLDPFGGVFKVASGLSTKYPDRVFSTPISEQAMAGIANGLAITGFRPFLEIMFGDFITLCMDQIINHAAKFYHMYNKKLYCPIVVRMPAGGGGGMGATHSQSLDKFVAGIDNVSVVALNSLVDPREIYNNILVSESHPVIVIENKRDYGRKIAAKQIDNYIFEKTISGYPVVRIKPKRTKPNATIVTYGAMADTVLDCIKDLFLEIEIIPEIIVLSKINPVDYTHILESVSNTKKLYVVEEGSASFGIGSEIIASVREQLSDNFIARRIASLPVPIPSVRSLENEVLPGTNRIINSINESLS